jgi:hypothetical protein
MAPRFKYFATGECEATLRIPGPSVASLDSVVVMGFRNVNAGSDSPSNAVATARMAARINSAFTTFFGVELATGWRYTGCKVRAHWDSGTFDADTLANVSGTGVSEAMIPSIALLVRKATGIAGRHNSGRMFLPGVLRENQVDNGGLVVPATLTAIQASLTTLMTALTAPASAGQAQVIPIIVRSGSQPNPTPFPLNATVLAYQAQPLVATQRRRLR